jgi:hypothetical protein
MIKIEFTEEEKQALDYERYNYPDPRVQRKMGALWLKSLGLIHEEICRVTGISPNTLRSYLRAALSKNLVIFKLFTLPIQHFHHFCIE